MKNALKRGLHGVFLLLALPMAALSGFGRVRAIYLYFAHACALVPGLPGDYLRIAYYKLTLEECSLESRIEFGSFCAHRHTRIARGVYVGAYCVLGRTSIGERTQIASGVQILSGRRQHGRDREGKILGSDSGTFQSVSVGADCWIGAGAIVMADVGPGATVGAGSVVVAPVAAGTVVVGNPARVLKQAE